MKNAIQHMIMSMNTPTNVVNIVQKIFQFYLEGFKNMRVGKMLWSIIAIKLFLFFFIMKVLFFPNFLEENFSNDKERAEYVVNNLTKETE